MLQAAFLLSRFSPDGCAARQSAPAVRIVWRQKVCRSHVWFENGRVQRCKSAERASCGNYDSPQARHKFIGTDSENVGFLRVTADQTDVTKTAVAKSRKVVHNGGHKTKAGPLTKPCFIGFLGFPGPAAENPSLSASFFESYSTRFRAGHRAPQIPEGSGCRLSAIR
jgi:hypothetical protein